MKKILIFFYLLFLPFIYSFAQETNESSDDVVNLADEFIKGKNAYKTGNYSNAIEILDPLYSEIQKVYTDTSQFIYLNAILGDSYFQTKQTSKALTYFVRIDSFCTASPNLLQSNAGSCIFSIIRQIDHYDQVNEEAKSLPLIQRALAYYNNPQITKDDNYHQILHRLTSYYISTGDNASLTQHLNSLVIPNISNYQKDPCLLYSIFDPILLYLEKEKEYILVQSILKSVPDSIENNTCYAGFLYHKYASQIGTKNISTAENYLSQKFKWFASIANSKNHGPYLYLLQAQKRWAQGDIDSLEVLLSTIETKDWLNELSSKRVYYLLRASSFINKNEWNNAFEMYQKALASNKDPEGDLHVYSELALFYDQQGDYTNSDIYYNKILTAPGLQTLSPTFLGRFYSSYANHFQQMGKWKEADNAYNKATSYLSNSSEGGQAILEHSLNNQAVFYLSMGKTNDALKIYDQLITKKSYDKNADYVLLLENKASALIKLDRFDEALKTYNEAISLASTLNMKQDHLLDLKSNNAFLLIKQKKYDVAEIQFQLLIQELQTKKSNSILLSKALSNLAEAQEHTLKYEEAYKNYTTSLSIREQLLGKNHPELAGLTAKLARIAWTRKDWANADINWSKTLQNYKLQVKFIFPVLTEKERIDFYNTFKNQFEQFNSYAFVRGQQERAWFDSMFVYQGLLQGLLFKSDQHLQQLVASSSSSQVKNTYEHLVATRQQIANRFNGNNQLNADSLLQQVKYYEKELTVLVGAWEADMESPLPSTLRTQLKEDECVVQMLRFKWYKPEKGGTYVQFTTENQQFDSTYYVGLIVKKNQSQIEYEVYKDGAIMDAVGIKYYLNAIKFKLEDLYSYTSYWGKIDKHLSDSKIVYWLPEGVYNLINPISLQNNNKEFLLEKYNIIRLSSINELTKTSKPVTSISSALLIGNPLFRPMELQGDAITLSQLPGTQREMTMIQNEVTPQGINVNLIQDSLATENAFRTHTSKASVVHIATHGYFLNIPEAKDADYEMSHPLFSSGLFLSCSKTGTRPSDNDGVLSAYEVSSMNLSNVNLVILSACQSGLGVVKNGEGVYGLQRAFRTAGARTVIMSLWKVDDEATAYFMNAFYQNYKTSFNASEALVYAQKQTKSKYPEPNYWAAFCLIGK